MTSLNSLSRISSAIEPFSVWQISLSFNSLLIICFDLWQAFAGDQLVLVWAAGFSAVLGMLGLFKVDVDFEQLSWPVFWFIIGLGVLGVVLSLFGRDAAGSEYVFAARVWVITLVYPFLASLITAAAVPLLAYCWNVLSSWRSI